MLLELAPSEKELTRDVDGDWQPFLLVDVAGRSALDIASDADSSPSELQELVQSEATVLARRGFDPRHTWSIIRAAKDGNLAAVRRLVEAGAEIHHQTSISIHKSSAMGQAAKRGHSEVVGYLLQIERERSARSNYTPNALEEAVRDQRHADVKALLEAREFLERADESHTQALHEAAANGDVQLAQLLISHGASVNNVRTNRLLRITPLECAAKGGHLEMVQCLLRLGATTEPPSGNHPSALKHAATGGFSEVVDELLQAGAQPNSDNALHIAAFGGHENIVRKLLEAGAGLDTSNEYENPYRVGHLTALQEAARGGHLNVVETLLQAGADVNAPARDRGMTALQAAITNGSTEVVKRLIASGADINAPAEAWSRTALQAAAEKGDIHIVNMLLDGGAQLEKSAHVDGHDAPALQLATKAGHLSVASRLLQATRGPHPEARKHEYVRDPRTIALHTAAHMGYEQLVQDLLTHGTPIAELDNPCLLVPYTASKGHTSIVRMLLDAGAEMDGNTSRYSRTSHSCTALQSSARGGHMETTRLLLGRGADVNAAPARVESPLHLACRNGDEAMAQILLDTGADIYAVSYSGESVRQVAHEGGSAEVIELLNEREKVTPDPREQKTDFDVSQVCKKHLCSVCLSLPLEFFTRPDMRKSCQFHPSLTSLLESARSGCPFCMFFWQQLDIRKITIPQPSKVILTKGFDTLNGDRMWAQIEEPYPKDVERPKALRADFHVCSDPLEGKRKALPGDTASPATFRQIKSWLRRCIDGHPMCKGDGRNGFMPTRLIDLRRWTARKELKLIESSSLEDHSQPYMTLSHRWDGQKTATASTTTSNISDRLRSLPTKNLPLTFVHAVVVAHNLNVDYLWIDSLCIVQDSPEDWTRESSLMSNIYRNAYCTIAAQVPPPSTDGLFRSRYVENDSAEFSLTSKDGKTTRMVRAVKEQGWWTNDLEQGPLQLRGWCLQERELSYRVIHYTPDQVLWECRSYKASEGLPDRDMSFMLEREHNADLRRILDVIALHDSSKSEIFALWQHTTVNYSARKLTDYEDTLPALGGLARIVQTYLKSDYVAGMWTDDLLRSLAWFCTQKNLDFPWRHPVFVAPSWSWASLRGIKSPGWRSGETEGNSYTEVVSEPITAVINTYNVELATSDPFGRITSAELHITTRMLDCILDGSAEHTKRSLKGLDATGAWHKYGDMYFDVLSESEGLSVVNVICLFRFKKPCAHGKTDDGRPKCGVGIALVPVPDKKRTYKRVGHVWCLRMAAFQELQSKKITLL